MLKAYKSFGVLSRVALRPISVRFYSAAPRTMGIRPFATPANTIIKFVPQQEAWTVERFGRFHRVLEPGLQILIPFVDEIKYVNSLKEVAIEIPSQSAITQDNVGLDIDGVLYVRVTDPYKASYGVQDPEFAVTQLAQTTMRAAIGQMTLDKTLAERQSLNQTIVEAINAAAIEWGIQCLRYEIRDIHPPEQVTRAMMAQVSAERQKRADILASEGQRQAAINVAEGQKQAQILRAEAQRAQVVNQAKGEAEGVLLAAKAQAEAIARVSEAIGASQNSHEAVSLTVAEKYIDALKALAKESTTVLMDTQKVMTQNGKSVTTGLGGVGDAASMVATAMSVFESVKKQGGSKAVSASESDVSASPAPKQNQGHSELAKSSLEFPLQ